MPDNSSSVTKRLVLFSLTVVLAAWAIATAVDLITSVWWQLLVIAAVVLLAVVGITTWKSRR